MSLKLAHLALPSGFLLALGGALIPCLFSPRASKPRPFLYASLPREMGISSTSRKLRR